MTDTPKTLAEELGNIVPEDHCEHDVLIFRSEVLEIAERHEARWAAERAKLVEELKAFRALAKRAVARLQVLRECNLVPADIEIELARLAPKENAT